MVQHKIGGKYGLKITLCCSTVTRIKCWQTTDLYVALWRDRWKVADHVRDQSTQFFLSTLLDLGLWWWIFLDFSSLKPKHELFLILTKWFLWQNLTRSQPQHCHNIKKLKGKEIHYFNISTCCFMLPLCCDNIFEEAVG